MAEHETPTKNPLISDDLYIKLEYLARVVLPGVAALYVALVALWGFPNGAAVVGTIVAVDTFLGVFLGFAQKAYDASEVKYVGVIDVVQNDTGGAQFTLNLGDSNPLDIITKDAVSFKVNTVQSS